MLSLLLLPFKILKFIVVSALKLFIFLTLCVIILNYIEAQGAKGNVHSFQESPRTEGNYTARC